MTFHQSPTGPWTGVGTRRRVPYAPDMRRIPICLLLLMAVACLDTERRRRDDEPSPPPSGETGEGEREGGLPCLPQAKLDLLWVISNSGSMCQEQTSLGRDFVTFSEQLVRLSADVNVAIITTDAEDPARSGRFRSGSRAESSKPSAGIASADASSPGRRRNGR